jgi:zinc transport system substrate-binding protein
MNKKQKFFLTSILLITIIILSIITYSTVAPQATNKLQVITTFYPLTYLTQQIGGEYVEVTQLIPNNTDVHSWDPSISHIMAAENADIIFYNGADADHWMEENILPALSTSNSRCVVETTHNLELITNNEQEHDDEHNHEHDDNHDHGLYDPHTWLSPYMAKQQAENIYNTLITIDPQHENYYTQRWNNLKQKLEQIDNAYLNGLSNTNKTTIFVSHDAYGYLANRYGFTQHGVIGLSADQQPSIITLNNIINEMKEHQTYNLYFDPVYSDKYIQTIKNDVQTQTGQTVNTLKLYIMTGPIDGLDYLEQMQINLTNLQTGLEATNNNIKQTQK